MVMVPDSKKGTFFTDGRFGTVNMALTNSRKFRQNVNDFIINLILF